jgi:hypothetical protein
VCARPVLPARPARSTLLAENIEERLTQ